jgi:hypothetical protein
VELDSVVLDDQRLVFSIFRQREQKIDAVIGYVSMQLLPELLADLELSREAEVGFVFLEKLGLG